MSTILQFRPKTISTKTIRRRLKDFQNGRKKKQQEVSEIHDCLSQLMLRLSWSKIYCSGMVMTYAKLNCVKVFVYIITMDILYVTIIILNGLKRYFCQRPPDWISTYKTTYISGKSFFFASPLCGLSRKPWTRGRFVTSRANRTKKLWFSAQAVTRVECVGVFLNEMNASFFTIASLSLKIT